MPNENPLRILVIASRPLTDGAGNPIVLLDVEEEWRRLRVALDLSPSPSPERRGERAAFARFLPEATTGAIIDALADEWDVVHLTGHGASDARVLLEDEFGEGQLVGAQELTQLFGARIPRVVVLSLCYSARAAATALRDAGIGAVVAIEADQPIADKAAIIFNQQFYAMLARGAPVGAAFERAQTRVVQDAQVGDAHPPLDGDGKPEAPWSQRFTLIGDGNIAFAVGAFDKTPSQPEPRAIGNLRERNASFVGRAKEIVEIVKTFDGRGV